MTPAADAAAEAVAGRPARRELTVATVLAVAGGALALYASSRAWVVTETPRPQPFPPLRATSTGRDVAPWLPAAAFVALAGGIALLATRRVGRVAVGAVLAAAGAGMVAGAVAGCTTGAGPGRAEVTALWPAACVLAGSAALGAGLCAAVRGRHWTTLGARYAAPGADRPERGDDPPALWDSLDRGEDPTTG